MSREYKTALEQAFIDAQNRKNKPKMIRESLGEIVTGRVIDNPDEVEEDLVKLHQDYQGKVEETTIESNRDDGQ